MVLKRMLPCVSKKRNQVKAAIDYLDKITADRFIEILNSAINERKRRPPRRSYLSMHLGIPLTRNEGRRRATEFAAAKRRFKLRVKLTPNRLTQMKAEVLVNRKSLSEVANAYGLSYSSVRRVVTGQR